MLFLTNNRLKSSSKPNTCHLSYRAVHPQIEFSLKLRKLASVKPPQVSEKQMVNAYFSSTFVVAVIFALYSLINHLHSLPRSYKKPKGNFNKLSLRKCLNNFSKSTFVLFVLIKLKMPTVILSFFYRRPVSPPRSLRQQTPTLQRLPSPPSSEHPNLLLPSPLSPSRLVQHRHPSPFRQTQPHLSARPHQLEAGSDLRAPCHRSATPWMKCFPPV